MDYWRIFLFSMAKHRPDQPMQGGVLEIYEGWICGSCRRQDIVNVAKICCNLSDWSATTVLDMGIHFA